ncbi:MAG: hypothetical protein P8Y58_16455 [Novosphingobium sp.]
MIGKSPAAQIAENYESQFLYYLGEAFGAPIEGLDYSVTTRSVTVDTAAPTMMLKAGAVAYLAHRWESRSSVPGAPKIIFSTHWYMADEVRPEGLPCEDYYRISIEGRPSLRIGVEMYASLTDDSRTAPGDTIVPVFYVTSATMIQAIPAVVDAASGVRAIEPPTNDYWKVNFLAT